MFSPLLSFALVASSALAASTDEWRSRSIYQLVTDRFATSDDSSPTCNTDDRVYCGGTWKGIVNKLDYIQGLGFDAVWISPIVKNIESSTGDGESYHGYWATDLNSLNDHFGTAADLNALSSALHKRGMYLMVDVVVNHLGGTSVPPDYSQFAPFNKESDFHPFCWITDYTNQTDVERCWLGDSTVPLVDVNTDDASVAKSLNSWVSGLVSNYSIDGLRIDTVKHVALDFWSGFNKAAGVYTVGEILDGDVNYVSPYTENLGGILDYPSWYQLTSAFQSTSGSFSSLVSAVQSAQSAYSNGTFTVGSFLENHDNPRFQSLTTDQGLVKNAITWPFIQDGIPIFYYGQEQGYTGGADPANREALWSSGYVTENKPLVQLVKSLNAARKAAIAADSSFLTTAITFPSQEGSTLAVSKPPLLALLTNGGASSTPSWTVSKAGYTASESLIDTLTCKTYTADSSGGVSVTGSQGAPVVLLPTIAFNQTYCKSLLS